MAKAKFKPSNSPVLLEMSAEEAVVVWSLTAVTVENGGGRGALTVYQALHSLLASTHTQRRTVEGEITLKGAN